MYASHAEFRSPADPAVPIWRYMDLPRLVSLLRTETLWFARADTLGDPHEGSLSPKSIAVRKDWAPSAQRPELDMAKKQAEVRRQVSAVRRMTILQTFVNCWHMSSTESMAMWSIYGASSQGVAVRSTYQRLCDSLQSNDPTHVGTVTYIDPETEPVPERNDVLIPFVYKRRAFQYEHELRALILGTPRADDGTDARFSQPGPLGLAVAVDLKQLVTDIVTAPGLDQWLVDVVSDVVRAFAPNIPVRRSALDVEPIY